MIDAYCHLDVTAPQPISDLEHRMDAAGVDRALVVETWSGDNRSFLQQLISSPSSRFRLAFCFRPDGVQSGLEFLSLDMVRALRVKSADLRRLGQIVPKLESTGKWLLLHAESGIGELTERVLQFSALYPRVPVYLPHMGWPRREKQDDVDWRESILKLSKLGKVMVGVSAMAHFSHEPFPHNDLAPFTAHLLVTFGKGSLVAASDYPMFEKDRYSDYVELANSWIADLRDTEHHLESRLFGEKAVKQRG